MSYVQDRKVKEEGERQHGSRYDIRTEEALPLGLERAAMRGRVGCF